MIERIGNLGQSNPIAETLTDIYTVPASTQSVISSLMVCNLSAGPARIRVSVRIAGESDGSKQYLYYNLFVEGNNTFAATLGITLNAGDVVSVYSTTGNTAFNLFGVEKT